MRKILAMAGIAITSMLFTGRAFAQGAPPPPPPAGGAPAESAASADDDKKIGIGGDLLFMLPLGDFGKVTGPQIGPVFRFGYSVMPQLELTGRIGYLFGLGKTPDGAPSGVSTSVSNIPIWLGARYFFMEPHVGLYGSAELAINLMTEHSSGTIGGVNLSGSKGFTREGFNLGAGYVISKDLPIDFRAQLSYLNLLGTETGETAALAIGIGAGYTFQF